MLCDQVIAWAETGVNDDGSFFLPEDVQAAYAVLSEKLQKTQRFVLDRAAVQTVHSVSESTPKRFLQALGVCRLPYPSLWVEFSFQDRVIWIEDAAKRGMIVETIAESSPPGRLGFFLEQQDAEGRVMSVIPCWSHPDKGVVSICHMMLVINTTEDEIEISAAYHEEKLIDIQKTAPEKKKFQRWMNDPSEIAAGIALEARISEQIPDFMFPLWHNIIQTAPQEVVQKLVEMTHYDLKSEWRFVLALLTVLNSRNIIQISDEVDLSKINKQRQKKGVLPLATYRNIRLNLSRVQKNRLGAMTNDPRNLQASIVRGHWKLRKSGLFWWNPHVRGNIGIAPVTTTFVRG